MEDKDLVSLYMEDISKYKILTKEEEEGLGNLKLPADRKSVV